MEGMDLQPMQIAEAGNASWKAGDGTEINVQLLQICQLQYLS